VRYAKLALGVLLAIAGLLVTFGAVFGIVWYVQNCVGAVPGSIVSEVCQRSSSARVAATWVIVALMLDGAAVVVIRGRRVPWASQLHAASKPAESS
jgi:hypothetical protein